MQCYANYTKTSQTIVEIRDEINEPKPIIYTIHYQAFGMHCPVLHHSDVVATFWSGYEDLK